MSTCKVFLKGFKLLVTQGGNITFYSSNLFLLVTRDHMQIFKIIAVLLMGYIWLNLKFTSKYTIVGGEGGVSEFFVGVQTYSFGHS